MNSSFNQDIILIEALKNGNEEAFKYLYATKYKDIVHYVSGFTHDYDKAEDIVQEVIVKIWKNRHKIEITSSIKSYLYKAAYYSFINDYKKDKRKESLSEKMQKTAILELIDTDEEYTQQRLQSITKIIEQLPKKRKEIFILSKNEGLSYEEIASHLEISIKTVESQICKALHEIRSKINAPDFKIFQIIIMFNWPFLN